MDANSIILLDKVGWVNLVFLFLAGGRDIGISTSPSGYLNIL